jgi:segregation and condensation protein A
MKEEDEPLILSIEGFEGPLDLLLDLARRQKVDLAAISILALVEQYLAFIEAARVVRLELAADYLVMAAWLAFLKSRLLLPEPPEPDEPSAADLAAALAHRLKRLETVRKLAGQLKDRKQLHRDIFPRGAPEPIDIVIRPLWQASLHDLLRAYASQRQKQAQAHVTFKARSVWSLEEARSALVRLTASTAGWQVLDTFLLTHDSRLSMRPTLLASGLCAALEMTREGQTELRQDVQFGTLYVRRQEAQQERG